MGKSRAEKRSEGDGAIVAFPSVVDAVRSAVEIQGSMAGRNDGAADDRSIRLRIGVHLGDVVEEADGDLMATGSMSRRASKALPRPAGSASQRTPGVR